MSEATSAERQCPRCAETIEAAAVVCRYCRAEFDSRGAVKASGGDPTAEARARRSNGRLPPWMVITAALVVAALLAVSQLGTSASASFQRASAELGYGGAPTPSGMHCLDLSIGGLNADLWFAVKHSLHDPDSMTDKRMEIFPADAAGNNRVLFTFRAKNLYGAVQRSEVEAHLRNATCAIVDWKLV